MSATRQVQPHKYARKHPTQFRMCAHSSKDPKSPPYVQRTWWDAHSAEITGQNSQYTFIYRIDFMRIDKITG